MIGTLNLQTIAAATGGVLTGTDISVDRICTDSRKVQAGDLFVALSGDNFDGNQFVGVAKEAGAVASVVSEATDLLPNIRVLDTRRALGLLALANRRRFTGLFSSATGMS